jgi:GntR family transcriptional regulator, transcriptional repressor for pyruvate dehydrogenase complex
VPLRAVEKRSLPDKVFEQLTAEIVSGRYAPGATIPSERELSEILGVNRHVVREAVKRMEQIGLVKVAHGGRTRVLDFRRTAGLDLLALVAEHAEATEGLLPLLLAALEMRAGIGADLARLCAQRASSEAGGKLVELAERLATATERAELVALDQRFWQTVLDGAGNLAYQLAFNSLIRAVHSLRELSVPWLEQELEHSDYRRPIAAAIAAGDAESAAAAARAALTPPAATAPPAQRTPGATPPPAHDTPTATPLPTRNAPATDPWPPPKPRRVGS